MRGYECNPVLATQKWVQDTWKGVNVEKHRRKKIPQYPESKKRVEGKAMKQQVIARYVHRERQTICSSSGIG